MDITLSLVRFVHFTASVMATGAVFFDVLVARRTRDFQGADVGRLPRRLRRISLTGIGVAIVSGAAWLVAIILGLAEGDADARVSATAWTVVTGTQFGHVCLVRLVLAGALFYCLRYLHSCPRTVMALAAAFAASLAWTGHSGAMPGLAGSALALSDMLHLIAVSWWVGGLAPLALLIRAAELDRLAPSQLTTAAVHRFSALGLVAVGAIIATGVVNTLLLTDLTGLRDTAYGRLLLAKLGIVAVMIAIAMVNRFYLMPRLGQASARISLARHALVEAALGVVVLAIIGALGTLTPQAPTPASEPQEHLN